MVIGPLEFLDVNVDLFEVEVVHTVGTVLMFAQTFPHRLVAGHVAFTNYSKLFIRRSLSSLRRRLFVAPLAQNIDKFFKQKKENER